MEKLFKINVLLACIAFGWANTSELCAMFIAWSAIFWLIGVPIILFITVLVGEIIPFFSGRLLSSQKD